MERIITSITSVMIILIIILASYCWHKKYFSYKDESVLYIMGISRRYFIEYLLIGILGTIFWGIFSVICIINSDIIIFCILYCFVLLGIAVFLCIFLEKYVLTTDSFIHYIPLLPPKKVKLHEITTVKYTENRTSTYAMYGAGRKMLVGYHNKKKLFSIDESLEGFDLLHHLFLEAGKIERTPIIENFSITESKGGTIFSFIFFSALFAVILWYRDEVEWYYFIIAAFLMLLAFSEAIHALLWKVTIDFHTISVRNSFGIVKTYELSQITEVQEQRDYIVLFSGKEKIVKISKNHENFDFFLERLLQRGIEVRRMYS